MIVTILSKSSKLQKKKNEQHKQKTKQHKQANNNKKNSTDLDLNKFLKTHLPCDHSNENLRCSFFPPLYSKRVSCITLSLSVKSYDKLIQTTVHFAVQGLSRNIYAARKLCLIQTYFNISVLVLPREIPR